jgi:anaerobic magnesium-protoporphyrin IX monomethyl ester cyclase
MHYRHALCLYPYAKDQEPGLALFPPTGLEYIAAALKGRVGRISLIDLRHERDFQEPRRLAEFIRAGVDLLCVSVYWKARYAQVCDFISRLPAGPQIIVGGRQASEEVDDVLQRCPNISAVVRGEGEQTVQEIAAGKAWEEILGVSYRRNGQIVHNPNRSLQPIDQIAPPDRRLRRCRYYPSMRGVRLLPVEFDTILGSRGCPYKCTFCTFSLNPLGQKRDYVARTVESVVDEIEASPAKIIMFADDNFFVLPERVERMCDLLLERRIDKLYFANARIELARYPRMLEKAWRAGFRMILLGLESANDRTLAQLHKGFTTRQVREAFTVLRRFPFFYHGYFIYGNVGESEQDMLDIADFAKDLGVHAIGLSKLRVDKFTPLREQIEATPGYTISSNGYIYSKDFDKKRLRKIRSRIHGRFTYRPSQLALFLTTLNDCRIVTYPQMARLGMMSPLFLLEYGERVARRAARRLRGRWGERRRPAAVS